MRIARTSNLAAMLVMSVIATVSSVAGTAVAEQGRDSAAIQLRIDALSEKGGVVALGEGTYLIEKSIVLPDFVTLLGAGRDKTILKLADGVNEPVVRTFASTAPEADVRPPGFSTHHVTIKDLTVDGNAEGNRETHKGGIWLQYAHDYRVENVLVTNARGIAGLLTNPDHSARHKVRKNYIVNCIIEGTKGQVTFGGHPGNGMWITGATNNENILIKGNIVRQNQGSGIFIEDDITNIFIEDNDVYENSSYGVWIATCRNMAVTNNRIHHNGRGIVVAWGSSNIEIRGNEIYNNLLEAISIATPESSAKEPTYCVVIGNTLRNNNQLRFDCIPAIDVGNQFNTIAFNTIVADEDVGSHYFGIALTAPNNIVVNNYMEGCRGADYWLVDEHNTVVEWDKDKPWKPDNLVGLYR